MTRTTLALVIACSLVVCFAPSVPACKVPVFRYALERWPADEYRMVAIVDGDRSDVTDEAIQRLREIANLPLNVETEIIDLSKLSEAELWAVDGLEHTDQVPVLQVFYPEKEGTRKLCWSGELTVVHVNQWIDSPLRQAIVKDIQSGVSAVWVFVDGKDEQQNAQMFADLEQALRVASDQISIPDGVIRREHAARYLKENPSASMDDVLRSDIPLRIDFSIHRLKASQSGGTSEAAMRAMTTSFDDSIEAPFVFPVFGRGRMVTPLTADAFKESAVLSACKYMVGECSCSVKALNPGVDLILKTDWRGELGSEIVMVHSVISETPTVLSIPPGLVKSDATPVEHQTRSWLWGVPALTLVAAAVWLYRIRMPSSES